MGLLLAETTQSQKSKCNSSELATQSILWEACLQNKNFCYLLLADQDKDPDVRVSIYEHMVINDKDSKLDATQKYLMPKEYVEISTKGKTEIYQYQGQLAFYDNRTRARNIHHASFYTLRSMDGDVLMIPMNQVSSIYKASDSQLTRHHFLNLLRSAKVQSGTRFVSEAGEWVVEEVQGEIIDKSSQYIFLRNGNRRMRYPLQGYINAISNKLPPAAISQARNIVKSGGKAAQVLLKSPIASILEMSLSPTMAACADASHQFVKNICSGEPSQFREWFRDLTPYDREEVLKDPSYCDIFANIIERDVSKLRKARESSLADFKKNWTPQKIQCTAKEGAEFILDKDSLAPQTPKSESIYYRYIIREECHSSKCDKYSLRTEKRMIGSESLLSTPHKYVFSDLGVRISGLNPQYEKSRIPAKEISEANLFLQRWLVDQVAKHCWNDLTKGVERLAVDPNAPPGVTF